MLPRTTLDDFTLIREKALAGHLRHLPPSIAGWQAITTHIRHNHTDYDALLADGYDAESARHFVLEDMNEVLMSWGSSKLLSYDEDPSFTAS